MRSVVVVLVVDRTFTVGITYPGFLHAGPNGQQQVVDELQADFPDVEFILEPWVDDAEQRTRRSAPGYVRGDDTTPVTGSQRAMFKAVDAVLALDLPFDVECLAPRLRWVQATGTGIGQFASSGLKESGIRLTNAAGTSASEIGEFVFARILQHAKRLPAIDALQQERTWKPVYGASMTHQTVGLVGMGAINQRVAELAQAFDMRVLATRRSMGETPPNVDVLHASDDLMAMVAQCDVVVAALPETTDTCGLFDRRVFAAMRAHALFCNVGRGSAVVDSDLIEALGLGRIGAAALDVFDQEPLPEDSPYWDSPNAYLSAHCSSVPDASIQRVVDLFRENLNRYLAEEPLRNEVDLVRGY